MERAREIARQVQAGERAAMRRWLKEHLLLYATFPIQDMDKLSEVIRKVGGDPEKIRAVGRKRVETMLYMEAW